MQTLRLLIVSLCLFPLFRSIPAQAEEAPRAAKRAMKGIELYSWRDETTHAWLFALVPGTNRNKTADEIRHPQNTLKTVEELKTRLSALAVEEYVTWNPLADPTQFSLPPEEIIRQISALSEARHLQLRIECRK